MNQMTPSSGRKPQAVLPDRPNRPMNWLRSEIDRLFDDMIRPGTSMFAFSPRFDVEPALELVDEGDHYRATAELPGLTDKDVSVTLTDGVLTIAGEKRDERNEKKNGCLIDERRYGSFTRQLGVPADVDPGKVTARFKDGVLTVNLAKDHNVPPQVQKIPIEG